MANDLSLLGGNLPAHLQGQLDDTTRSLMGGGSSGGSSIKRISIRGSVFRMLDILCLFNNILKHFKIFVKNIAISGIKMIPIL